MNAGLGFRGYNENGRAQWDLLNNVNIPGVEFSSSLKVVIDSWNIMTNQWLRYICYERLHSQLAVFILSAFWHGFYGGYYVMFITASLFIETGRHIRRNIRPHFQNSQLMKVVYGIVTYVVKAVAFGYFGFPFIMLEFWSSIKIYSDVYFFLHIPAVMIIVYYTLIAPRSRKAPSSQNHSMPSDVSTTTYSTDSELKLK